MNKIKILVSSVLASVLFADKTFAANTAVLTGDLGSIEGILNAILTTLNVGAVFLGTASIIYAGFLYTTAADNSSQVAKAKEMIRNTILGIIVWMMMWLVMDWLIPGGAIK